MGTEDACIHTGIYESDRWKCLRGREGDRCQWRVMVHVILRNKRRYRRVCPPLENLPIDLMKKSHTVLGQLCK